MAGSALPRRLRAAFSLVGLVLVNGMVAGEPRSELITVSISSPPPGEPAVGIVEIAATVTSAEELNRVEFLVDGELTGVLYDAPYRFVIDAGVARHERRFEVVAYTISGREARAARVTPRIRIDEELDLELQELYVTVTEDGRRVTDLDRDDFTVVDQGVEQELLNFDRGGVPLTAFILVDASDSMRGRRLTAAVAGAEAFVSRLEILDQAKLVLFSDRVRHATPMTSFQEILTAGLGTVTAGGGTALNDHLYLAIKRLEGRRGRHAVIVLSDGVDTASVLRMQDASTAVRRSQGLIYWIRLGGKASRQNQTSSWRDGRGHREELAELERAVKGSGGRTIPTASIDGIETTFEDVLAEIREQYVLGFYPRENRGDGSWHRVSVLVGRPGVQVRARAGYVDS